MIIKHMLKHKISHLLLLSFLFLFLIPVQGSKIFAAQIESVGKIYPFPQIELKEVIASWLKRNGFLITQKNIDKGNIHLEGEREDELWQITLGPRSPLASFVQAEFKKKGEPDQKKVDILWAYLSGYPQKNIKKNAQRKSPPDRSFAEENVYPQIPGSVLSQNEFVVCIKAGEKDTSIQFTGFIVDRAGIVLSTAHDLGPIKETLVTLFDDRQITGRVIRTDRDRDLALIDLNEKFDSCISLSNSRNLLGVGEGVFSAGCPINLKGTIYPGQINSPPRVVNNYPLWQVSMKIFPGSSGSPVFDQQGKLVGVVKGRYRGTDSIGFIIPIETIMEFLKQTDS